MTARLLSGIWVLFALATIPFPIKQFLGIVHDEVWGGGSFVTTAVIVCAAIAFGLAWLYGVNYRDIVKSDRHFITKSLFLTACPLAFAGFFGLQLVVLFANQISMEMVVDGQVHPLVVLFVVESLSLIIAILWAIVVGFRQRRESFLAALAIPGVASTLNHVWVSALCWTQIQNPADKGWTYIILLVLYALPGLWAALACFFASIFVSAKHGIESQE